MPYYTHEMVRYGREHPYAIDEEGRFVPAVAVQTRSLRVSPTYVDQVDASKSESKASFFDQALCSMRYVLAQEVDKIKQITGSKSSRNKTFFNFIFDIHSEPIKTSRKYRMYICTQYKGMCAAAHQVPLIVKVFDKIDQLVANPNYLKILRRIGKAHVNIVQTWDIYHDEERRTFLMQEYISGDELAAIAKKMLQPELLVRHWGRQLYSALDCLGSMAICHRSLKPTNILISNGTSDLKLNSFYNSIVYWDAKTEDISYIPCLAVASKNRAIADFEAPEVYGDPATEQFDPIMADVWSYAAVLYFAASQGNYPFDIAQDNPKVEKEIQANVDNVPLVRAKVFLSCVAQAKRTDSLTV